MFGKKHSSQKSLVISVPLNIYIYIFFIRLTNLIIKYVAHVINFVNKVFKRNRCGRYRFLVKDGSPNQWIVDLVYFLHLMI